MPILSYAVIPALAWSAMLTHTHSHAAIPPTTPLEYKIDKFLSGPGTFGYLGLGLVIPFAERDKNQTQAALRGADAVAVTVGVTEALKTLTKVPRPDNGEPDSFPSGHAAATFAMATVRAAIRPGQAGYWYAGSTLISISRVRLNRHRIADVLVGAGLGFGIARLELSQHRGLLLQGVIDRPTGQLESLVEQRGQGFQPLLDPGHMRAGIGFSTRF